MDMHSPETLVGYLAGIGAAIGLGQLLNSKEPVTPRLIFGRAIVSGGLSASSAALIIWLPEMSLAAQLGLGATLASLGTDFLINIVKKHVKVR